MATPNRPKRRTSRLKPTTPKRNRTRPLPKKKAPRTPSRKPSRVASTAALYRQLDKAAPKPSRPGRHGIVELPPSDPAYNHPNPNLPATLRRKITDLGLS